MATTKKTTKKVTSRKPATKSTKAKTVAAKKAPVKKAAVKKSSAKRSSAKTAQMRSFHISRDDRAFTSLQITRQTVYWLILAIFIIVVQLWVLKLQIEVATLVDSQQTQLQDY